MQGMDAWQRQKMYGPELDLFLCIVTRPYIRHLFADADLLHGLILRYSPDSWGFTSATLHIASLNPHYRRGMAPWKIPGMSSWHQAAGIEKISTRQSVVVRKGPSGRSSSLAPALDSARDTGALRCWDPPPWRCLT